jgi:membrane-associated phospholipid phosphatase
MPEVKFVTDFGDQAVLLPLAFCVGLVFALIGWKRGTLGWTVSIGGTFGLMLLLKLTFIACGHLLPFAGLYSPSGHTAAAAAVYGGLVGIAGRFKTGTARWAVPSALIFALVIGASRLALGVHSKPEVIIGGVVGVAGAFAATALSGPPPLALRFRNVAAVTVLVLLLLHGFRMPAEAAVNAVALRVWLLSSCR